LVAESLSKNFGNFRALDEVSFKLEGNGCHGYLGPNGAGKTTTLSMVATLLAPSYGDVRIFGKNAVSDVWAVRKLVGFVPQDVGLYPNLSARENLSFFGHIYGVPARKLRRRMNDVLDLVGLTTRADDRVQTYSGGMKRRLNLACGLVHHPRLLLLDEPTVGVDPQSREHILNAIQELAAKGTTVLYTTHYMEEAERLCDRIAIMDNGRIVAAGTLQELLEIVGMGSVIEIRGELGVSELRAIPEVKKVEIKDQLTRIFVTDAGRALGAICTVLAERPGAIESLNVRPVNLERVFMHLTGKGLRD
ncbi:MAG TPA: export ABC transporter ATP-binding protein, partial [Deltaproteobacteria bacterium]|nr:export ABC transporter ATP-binding protein [Deltaproteobacteria bacterium]